MLTCQVPQAARSLFALLLLGACAPELGEIKPEEAQTATELRPGYRVSLSTSPSSAPADGASSIAVTATVTDAFGNPMTGAPVQFAASASANNLISVSQATTNCKGQARTTIASNQAGTQTVSATRSVTTATTQISFSCPGPFLAPIGSPVFGDATSFNGWGIDSADINGDGNPDVVISAYANKLVTVLLGNGNGSFAPPAYLNVMDATGLALCDLNNDGLLDLATSVYTQGYISTFLGHGDGTFTANSNSQIFAAQIFDLACIDLNKDGNMDVLAANRITNQIGSFFGNGDGSLQGPLTYATGPAPYNISVADVNGDSYPDVVTANTGGSSLSLFINNGAGLLNTAISYTVGSSPRRAVFVDLNGDRQPDIVTTNTNSSTVTVLTNTGNGNFITASTTATIFSPGWVDVGDLDGDGKIDLAVTSYSSTTLGTHHGNGDGNFQVTVTYNGTLSPLSHKLIDLNRDGALDVVVPNFTMSKASIFLGTGTGTLVAQPNLSTSFSPYRLTMAQGTADTYPLLAYTNYNNGFETRQNNGSTTFTAPTVFSGVSNSQEIIFADFNNDNKSDIAVLSGSSSSNLYTYIGNGVGGFTAAYVLSTGNSPVNLAAADFNKDGNLDLAVSNQTAGTLAILLGAGNGNFSTPVAYGVNTGPRGVAITDINADGNLDVIVTNSSANSMSFLLGQGDGTLSAAVGVGLGSGPINTVAADLNGDGRVDFVSSLYTTNQVCIILGNNTTSPGSATYYTTGAEPWSLSVADVDGDTKLDVVVPSAADGSLNILLGKGDGSFKPSIALPSGAYTAAAVVLRDINNDGRLDALVGSFNTNSRNIPIFLGSGCAVNSATLGGSANALFSYTGSSVDLSGIAELTPSNSDTAANAFSGATLAGAAWDTNALLMRLGNNGNCNALTTNCAGLDPSWTPKYANLIGYWPMDGSGSIAAGGTIAGTVGPALTVAGATISYQAGHLGQGINLPAASNAYLALPANTPNSTSMTVMGWVNWSGGASFQRFFDVGSGQANCIGMTPSAGTTGISIFSRVSSAQLLYTSLPAIQANQWQHVAMTVDGNYLRLYVNGSLTATGPSTATPAIVQGPNNWFGRSEFSTDPYFNGTYDDLAMFSVALNANDVATVYNRQSALYAGSAVSRVLGPQSTTPTWSDLAWSSSTPSLKPLPSAGLSEQSATYPGLPTTTLNQAPYLLYHLDEPAAGTAPRGFDARDDSGQGNHGKVYNAVALNQTGRLGSSYGFDGNTATLTSALQLYNPAPFTISAWFSTYSPTGGKIIGMGNVANGNSTTYDRHIYIDSTGKIRFGMNSTGFATILSTTTVNDGRWHHVAAGFFSGIGMTLYVDGMLQASSTYNLASAFTGFWRIGGDNTAGWVNGLVNYFLGRIDEVAVYNRALSAAEVKQLWRRGGNRLKFQVRACTSMTCADNPGWLGPDGSAYSYFSEINNNSLPLATNGNVLTTLPDMNFASFAPALSLPNNPYFQYRMIMESDDANALCTYNGVAATCSPEVLSVRAGPSTYPTAGSLTSTSGTTYHSLTALIPTYGPGGCPGGVSFSLSNNGGTNWYWWNGYLWAPANGTATQSNSPGQLTGAILGAFVPQKGSGPITYRAFLSSSGTTPCSLANVTLNGTP
jgi:hypothetical protein